MGIELLAFIALCTVAGAAAATALLNVGAERRVAVGELDLPPQVAAQSEMVIVNPQGGRCMANPLAIGPARGPCYYDPFVAVRVTVPLKALWGATHFQYRVAVVGALTDNPTVQQPPTPIPTSTPGPIPTWPVPGPTCRPSDC